MIGGMSRGRTLLWSLTMAATLAGLGAVVVALVDGKNHLITAAAAVVAAGLGAIAPVAVDAYLGRKQAMQEDESVGRSSKYWKNLSSASPSDVLNPHREVIPFAGRDDEVRNLVAWCKNDGASRLRLITGAG